jgi:hypothetical protein
MSRKTQMGSGSTLRCKIDDEIVEEALYFASMPRIRRRSVTTSIWRRDTSCCVNAGAGSGGSSGPNGG